MEMKKLESMTLSGTMTPFSGKLSTRSVRKEKEDIINISQIHFIAKNQRNASRK